MGLIEHSLAVPGAGAGAGAEKRVHPVARAVGASGAFDSPVISHLSKGGRFSDYRREDITLPEDGPGCRAMVSYRGMNPLKSRASPKSSGTYPPLLALPPSSYDDDAQPTPRSASPPPAVKPLDMPVEVFPMIFQYMAASTLCSISSVSREWREQGNDDRYWRRLCRTRFNIIPDAFAPPPDPIKRLYQMQYGSLKAMCKGCGERCHAAPPSISAHTSAQLLVGLMASNAM